MPSILKKVKTSFSRRITDLRDNLSLDTDSTNSSTDYTAEQPQAAIFSLNLARGDKYVETIAWDDNLTMDAECYAQKLARRDKGLEHSGVQGQGESLFVTGARTVILHDAVKAWLDQEEKYKGGVITEEVLRVARDYTQCMWRATTHIGMGAAKAQSGKTYIVARFSPPGNVIGEKPY